MQKEKKTICEAGIVALTFNKERTQCAFSPNNHLVYVYSTTSGGNANDPLTWKHCHTLDAHQQAVSAIDWCQRTNRILTAGQDRQAFVWALRPYNAATSTDTPTAVEKASAGEAWVPQLVELDASVKRGLTSAKWGPTNDKFYVGSAAANVAVGTFFEENQWWTGRSVECHTSTVTSVSPHPANPTVLATGSTDGTVALVSTYQSSVDGKGAGEKFRTELSRVALPGAPWVHAVAFSPSGEQLAVVAHDSRLYILTAADAASARAGKGFAVATTVSFAYLPMRCVEWISEDALVAAGFDFFPVLVSRKGGEGGGWGLRGKWTAEKPKAGPVVHSQASLARMQFQNDARLGQKAAVELVNSRHKNTISGIWPLTKAFDGSNGGAFIFVTSGMDGQIEFWKADEMTPEA